MVVLVFGEFSFALIIQYIVKKAIPRRFLDKIFNIEFFSKKPVFSR